ncbi:MAG TPA: phage recombination protein Bet [Actinospica sp.]|jgi:phage recombination protein Bet|nr:phage recombination protein Bet [Actinospica sp.]
MTGTGNAIAVRTDIPAERQSGALAIEAGQTGWTPMQEAALGQLGLEDAPDGDRMVFLHVSQRTGLDPFARQIYMIPRSEKKSEKRGDRWVDTYKTKWTIQTGIEGWRTIRDRAERKAGVRGKLSRFTYYDNEGSEYKVWVKPQPPVACEVTYTVIDAGGSETPYTSVLRFAEYAQSKDGKLIAQWGQKPVHMLEKCTEADAYRKAFPQDYSGIEMSDTMPAVAKRPEDMTDEELDAWTAVKAPGYRPRVTAAQARERNPRTVTAVAETVTPDVPPAGEQPQPPSAAADNTPPEPAGGTLTEATWQRIEARLAELGVEEGNRVRVASQVARKSAKDWTEEEGRKVADTLEGLDSVGLDGLRADAMMSSDPREDGEPGE